MTEPNLLWINILCVLGLIAVTFPLLLLGHFNYPTADDWSLGLLTHQALENGEGIGGVLKAIGKTLIIWRTKGEPRYASILFASLQPGIFGEHFYRITTWMMIGGLCVSETMLCMYFFRECRNKKWILPMMIPSLMIQLLCVPYPEETLYWYVGSVNYTFAFGLSIVLLIIVLKLRDNGLDRTKSFVLVMIGCALAALVGGNNYATSLSSACLLTALSLEMLLKNRKLFIRTLPITLIVVCGLIICATAPGNQVRIDAEFGGKTSGVCYSIVMSLRHAALILYSWTTWKIIFMILLILPFLWRALQDVRYAFPKPVLFTLFSFGIYASQIAPNMYVGGDSGGGRMGDLLYYAYHVWLLLNVGYWLGWIQRSAVLGRIRFLCRLGGWIRGHITLYFCMVALSIAGIFCVTNLKQTSTYKACAWLILGHAQEYAGVWEERIVLLRDESVREIYFEPLPEYGGMIYYTDFYPGKHWVNTACMNYYKKDYVGLKPD